MNNELLLMVFRKLLTIGASVLITRGVIAKDWLDPELMGGIAMIIASLIWSNINRKKIEDVTTGTNRD